MGWNSFDCFGATVTEEEVLLNAEIMASRLREFGWDHVVVDYCWSHPAPPACTNPNQNSENQPYLAMDTDFRLLPAPERFPSARGGRGFKPLADRIHAMGLKFGIHIMRGFPKQAIYPGYPAQHLGFRPLEIADPESTCSWLNHMCGVSVASNAGQQYYDSLFRLYTSWGVDFVKADDLTFPYRTAEIEAIDRARQRCGRPITLSLSPGPCPVSQASHVRRHAEMWRICADFWDDWQKLKEAFAHCALWAQERASGFGPDPDMLPLGRLSKRGPVGPEHDSFFTLEEQRTLLTLWCIFGAPLFIGGNLPEMKEETFALLTNPEVLAVQSASNGGYPLFQDDCTAVWVAKADTVVHLALFNLSEETQNVGVLWQQLGLSGPPVGIRNLWRQKEEKPKEDGLRSSLSPHGCALYTLRLASLDSGLSLSSIVTSRCVATAKLSRE